jgi:hypothetical protein
MIFFSFIITPTIFRFLPAAQAGLYVRKLFPIYYIFNGSIVLISSIAIGSLGVFNSIFYSNVIILALFIFCFFYLMPEINKAKSKKKFKILHSTSVAINIVQILLLIFVTILLLDF